VTLVHLAVGTLLGTKYRLIRKLGDGSAGQVWETENTVVGHRAAVKVLHTELSRDAEMRARFFAEARAAGRIRHPNVVDVFDLGAATDGTPFMVMELCDGETLHSVIQARGAVGPSYASDVMGQVLGALEAAHALGIVHRDLKPANIMVVHPRPDQPVAKVLDFGIAQGLHSAHQPPEERGRLFGTPNYMAPEQVTGDPVDHRADIYAVGAILYELLTGRPPFSGSAPELVLANVLSRPPKPFTMFRGDVPEALEDLVRSALEKDALARPDSTAEFRRALSAFGSPSVRPAQHERPSDMPLPLARRAPERPKASPRLALSESSRPPRGDE
jgi:serine/threonine-protein kinase